MYSIEIGGDELSSIHWAVNMQFEAIEAGLLEATDGYMAGLTGLAEELQDICAVHAGISSIEELNSNKYSLHLRKLEQITFYILASASVSYIDSLLKNSTDGEGGRSGDVMGCMDSKEIFAGLLFKAGNMPANQKQE